MRPLIVFALLFFVVSACKKGEHDRFLSLKSRDSRITQKWLLMHYSYIAKDGEPGSLVTYEERCRDRHVETYYDGELTDWYMCYTVLDIDKNGSYTLKGQQLNSGTTSTIVRNWSWANSGKKKTGLYLFGNFFTEAELLLVVDRLTSKELVLKCYWENNVEPNVGTR